MKIIGHRGARGLAPENTLASIQKALDHKVDAVEFDLRVTKDGVVVLDHDGYITDPNGQKRRIADHAYAELKQHKPDLATLEEVIDTIGHQALIYPEIKPGEPAQPIIKVLKTRLDSGWKAEEFRVMSFNATILRRVRQELPDITMTVLEKWSGVRATYKARKVGTKHIMMNQRWLWSGFIRQISKNYKLGTYTLNDPKKASKWERYGLRAVVTDYPDRFDS
jgi:glycerophosphoryl diester phosphodiesterase